MYYKPSLFIIESLYFEDEKSDREGEILSDILNMSRKQTIYYYIRTKKELTDVLEKFRESEFRYLHFSCHGDKNNIYMTLDTLPFQEFGTIIRPYLHGKRLFMSACSAVNEGLAAQVLRDSGCYSLIGPESDIAMDKLAIAWASFYHLIFAENSESMQRVNISPIVKKIWQTFGIWFRYFARSSKPRGYVLVKCGRKGAH